MFENTDYVNLLDMIVYGLGSVGVVHHWRYCKYVHSCLIFYNYLLCYSFVVKLYILSHVI
jgi:hypothetical protein